MSDLDASNLSERELEILRLVATGVSNKEIAQKLYISSNTVKVHLRNIFMKIDVSSRTEASMWAVRQGLVQPFSSDHQLASSAESDNSQRDTIRRWIIPVVLIIFLLVLIAVLWRRNLLPIANPDPTILSPTVQQDAQSRWHSLSEMSNGRYGLTAVTHEEKIFVIGGEDRNGISAELAIYDPKIGQWSNAESKPTPVKNAQAAVLGGIIYMPGGELANGEVTMVMELFDQHSGKWEKGPDLPVPLSAYAMVSYEGELFVFGGWDGRRFRNETYVYTPGNGNENGIWVEKSPMPVARGFMGAAVSKEKIYIIGGIDNTGALLARNDVYTPTLDDQNSDPWNQGMSLPEGRYKHSISTVADLLFVIGGTDLENRMLSNFQFSPSANIWQRIENPLHAVWSDLGVTSLGTQLFTFGGLVNGVISSQAQSYQAVYTIAVPFIP